MHIVIPMSGLGQRFVDAGYSDPKPLILVDGKPIIQHVVEMFPGETKFSFICNSGHLANTNMKSVLEGIAPGCKVYEIPQHKMGPVYAVSLIFDTIGDDEEVIVNYCDFGKKWNYKGFLKATRENISDGAVSAYRGFHPHMLHSPNYAFILESEGKILQIQEKKPFTCDRMSEFASDGTYYFRTGAILKQFFYETMSKDINVNGEFYVSVVYNLMIESGLAVSIYEIEKMFQWGTPQDLEEYVGWRNLFKRLGNQLPRPHYSDALLLIPMAGKGSRFTSEGYATPKPLIEVGGKPMIVGAAHSLPHCGRQIFVALQEHLDNFPISRILQEEFPECKVVILNEVTEGQAITCSIGLHEEPAEKPVFIAASDNGMIYDHFTLQSLIQTGADVIAFGFLGGSAGSKNPSMYGWIRSDGDDIHEVSVKAPISDTPAKDHAIVGAFYFRSVDIFRHAVDSIVSKNIRVNDEFYADSLVNEVIAMGGTAKLLVVDHYICWGTPNDLRTYQYWEEHFLYD